MARSTSISKTAVWILLALLILGLAGFGATNMGGNLRTVGSVGDMDIPVQSYGNALQRELRAYQQQTGTALSMTQARELGVDRAVLQRLVTLRALDNEAQRMGLSIGDERVREQVLQIPAFQGLDGRFDRAGYTDALQRQGLSEAEFETSLREETARTLLQRAIVTGIAMPGTFADTLVSFAGERRSFTWTHLDATMLENPLEPATEEDLVAFHADNQDMFMLPAAKRIAYAWLTPDMLTGVVDLEESALREAYDARIDEFSQPERRLVERLVYLDEEAAAAAAARIAEGSADFSDLVAERGLSLQDVDLGDVGRLELDAAGEAVFAAEMGAVVGPLPSGLGPALFRVNGILAAQNVPYEEALPQLREEVALDRARRIIEGSAERFEDLLAGGATLEELAAETDMEMGEILWSEESGEGIAGYVDFREAAAVLAQNDFPEIRLLDDGGVFAMRLEEELPARPQSLEEAREDVSAAMEAQRTEAALRAMAEALLPQIEAETDFAALGLDPVVEKDRTRGAFIPSAPRRLIDRVFQMAPGAAEIVADDEQMVLVRLDAIAPAVESPEATQLRDTLQTELDQALAQDIFDVFANDVLQRAQPQIDQRAVDAVNANFQ